MEDIKGVDCMSWGNRDQTTRGKAVGAERKVKVFGFMALRPCWFATQTQRGTCGDGEDNYKSKQLLRD